MTDEERFQSCFERARIVVRFYRDQCPENIDPENWFVSTTLILLSLVSAAIGAVGAYSSGQAQSDAAKYNAAVARNNAGTATQQAMFDAQQIRDKNRRIIAQQRAAFGANGLAVDSGSAADVSADSAQQGEMQALMAIYTGKTSANASEAKARLFGMEAGQAQTAGYIGVGSNILGGATQAGLIAANPNFKHG